MPKKFDCEESPNEFMEMPCKCDCGKWFDLCDGYRLGNTTVCRKCIEDDTESVSDNEDEIYDQSDEEDYPNGSIDY